MPSSVVLKFSYNAETRVLRITFVSGKVYDYKDVPEEIYSAMNTSGSKGVFFNEHIKSNYKFTKVENLGSR